MDAIDKAEPIQKADPKDPIEPTEQAEPIEPIESTEPLDAIERNESLDHSDHFDVCDCALALMRRSVVLTDVTRLWALRRWPPGIFVTFAPAFPRLAAGARAATFHGEGPMVAARIRLADIR
jgi:hypothetical protein